MKTQLTYLFLIAIVLGNGVLITAQTPTDDEIKTGRLLRRTVEDGVDNYVNAAFSFKFGGNGPEVQKLCRNNWDILFRNSVLDDAFDVTMVVDDRGRIKDLGKFKWDQQFHIPRLPAYEEPEQEEPVRAIVGHMYLVHVRDRDNDHYALFRVERLVSTESVDITWKLIPPPKRL
ncbi:MAG TPA: hypothetical protein VF290_02825 [Pyrinomonadaceae bacterium]